MYIRLRNRSLFSPYLQNQKPKISTVTFTHQLRIVPYHSSIKYTARNLFYPPSGIFLLFPFLSFSFIDGFSFSFSNHPPDLTD